MSCPRCRAQLPSSPELDLWLREGKIVGAQELTIVCPKCREPMNLQGQQAPITRSHLLAGKLRCGGCGAKVEAAQLRPLGPEMPRGLAGVCAKCGKPQLVEIREDA